MAIFLALRSPEVEVIGLTTIYGNVYTTLATRNALHLVLFLFFWIDTSVAPTLLIEDMSDTCLAIVLFDEIEF